ncbi:hypothetical protein BRADI_2g23588v3 [Brachypodium distachyon]|uniref:Uncharacterized protein n=1 Tax=Brachypodium distachyon TaxID=15368 RepID=A0A2K2DA16_BRADI|nr:hypothetical protein BRADI_2g23588v3 [Brachypodium distachyon]
MDPDSLSCLSLDARTDGRTDRVAQRCGWTAAHLLAANRFLVAVQRLLRGRSTGAAVAPQQVRATVGL